MVFKNKLTEPESCSTSLLAEVSPSPSVDISKSLSLKVSGVQISSLFFCRSK